MGKDRGPNNNHEGAPEETTLTPQEVRFIKNAQEVIGQHLARTILVVSAALATAGIIAIEKTDSFDPLISHIDSANHLVLNGLGNSYEQLVDKLPEVEKAEATPPDAASVNPSPSGAITNGNCNTEKIDFIPHSAAMHVGGGYLTFTVDACLKQDTGIFVRLVEMDGVSDDILDSLNVSSFNGSSGQSVRITFHLDCQDGDFDSGYFNKLIGAGGATHSANAFSADSDNNAQLAVELDYDSYSNTNFTDNVGTDQGVALISCRDDASVGGIAELPDAQALPQDMTSEKSKDYLMPITASGAVAVAIVGVAGAGWYTRRKRSS